MFVAPLNARSRSDLGFGSPLSRSAKQMFESGGSLQTPLVKLHNLEGDWHVDDSSTLNIKKKLNSFDTGIKNEFKDLETKVNRNIKRN